MDVYNLRALVVDDMASMRRIVAGMLMQLGVMQIYEAEDGNAAYRKLLSYPFDFVVADWNMPKKTGIDLLKDVRSNEDLKDLPFIMLTAEAKRAQVLRAIQLGVTTYVSKPFTSEAFRERVIPVLRKLAKD